MDTFIFQHLVSYFQLDSQSNRINKSLDHFQFWRKMTLLFLYITILTESNCILRHNTQLVYDNDKSIRKYPSLTRWFKLETFFFIILILFLYFTTNKWNQKGAIWLWHRQWQCPWLLPTSMTPIMKIPVN